MATSKGQRIGIWVVALILLIGTVGGFLAMLLSYKNQTAEQTQQNKWLTAYYEYQAKVDAQAAELSEQYYPQFSQYAGLPAAFETDNITKLQTEDLLIGDGDEITKDSQYSAYYIGWKPDGKIFDQSIENGALKSPLSSSGNLIKGWQQGVIGMKIGGVRLLTIPSDLAYGSEGSGDDIPADTPLKFIIMLIPPVEEIAIPDFSE